jgi:membrane-associated phospholipid phosphatase
MLTYLSIAQYRAALAVTEKSAHAAHASPSAAVAAASVVILSRFYTQTPNYSRPLVPGAVEQMLADDKNAGFPDENASSVAAGETIGRAIAETVWAHAQLDGYNSAPTAFNLMVAARPIGPNYWILEGTAVRSLWGVKPFFLKAGETFATTPPPPATAALIVAANDVLTGMTVGPPQQLHVQDSIALFWNKFAPAGPFTAGEWNRMADDLIQSHKEKKEADAAGILAYANAAAFNAQIDCFTVKYTWWTPRPRQYATAIVPLFATPNHPSYPSGHSCVSSAFGGVLTDAFRDRKTRDFVTGKVAEAGMSRIYAGIHYPADIAAGQALGARAAARALKGKLE